MTLIKRLSAMRKSTYTHCEHLLHYFKLLLCNKMAKQNHLLVILLLLITSEGTDAQLFKALGNLILPAINVLNPKVQLFGPPPGFRPDIHGNFGHNNHDNFGSRNTICRNSIDGHTVCGFGSEGHHFDEGTLQPLATGFDEVLPSNCGRNIKDGTGKLCFPDGILCQQREYLFVSFLLIE